MEQIRKFYREGHLEVIEEIDGAKIVEYEGVKYSIRGEKRLTINSLEPTKSKDKTCDICGNTFVPSKFNAYFTSCPACRDQKKLDRKNEKKLERELARIPVVIREVLEEDQLMSEVVEDLKSMLDELVKVRHEAGQNVPTAVLKTAVKRFLSDSVGTQQ